MVMKAISIKSTIAAAATAATLLTSGIAPVATASAEPIIVGKVQPLQPNICITKPWICNGGIKLPPPGPGPLPPAPPPPAPPQPGMSPGAAAALGIFGGIVAGAALANAAKPKDVYVQPTGNAQAHSIWCHNRYKSFRDWDNSWQPYEGPRKQCISPYL
jgi:hypothetical protein